MSDPTNDAGEVAEKRVRKTRVAKPKDALAIPPLDDPKPAPAAAPPAPAPETASGAEAPPDADAIPDADGIPDADAMAPPPCRPCRKKARLMITLSISRSAGFWQKSYAPPSMARRAFSMS